MRMSDAGAVVAVALPSSSPDFDFDFNLEDPPDLVFELVLASFGAALEAASDSSGDSARSNFNCNFLSRRKPCFHPSIRWRACWATSSFPPKSKTKKEYAMRLVLAGATRDVKSHHRPRVSCSCAKVRN